MSERALIRPQRKGLRALFSDFSLTKIFLSLFSVVGILVTAAICVMVANEFIVFISEVGFAEFFTGTRWEVFLEPYSFGIWPLLTGTLWIVLIATTIALPLGILVAAGLHHFSGRKLTAIVKPSLEVLAIIPTVVYGYLAITLVTPILKSIFPQTEVFNALSAGIVVALMILPMISTLVHDALREIPARIREGAFALGAYAHEVFFKVEIKCIMPRLFAALVLALSRAFGETMAVTLAAGSNPQIADSPLKSIQTITSYIVQASMGDAPHGTILNSSIYAVSAILFFLTFLMNFFAYRWLRKSKYGVAKL